MGFFGTLGDFFSHNDNNKTDQHSNPSNSTNPASGLPMNGNIDVAGNPFGTNNQSNMGGMSSPNSFSDPFSNGF